MGLGAVLRMSWDAMPTLRRIGRWTLVVIAVMVGLFVAARITGNVVYGKRLEKEMERFKALGGTANLAELAPKPYTGPGTNPARYLEAAGLVAPSLRGETVSVDRPGLKSFDEAGVTDERKMEVALGQYNNSDLGELFIEVTPQYARQNTTKHFQWNDAWLPWLERVLAENAEALSLGRKGAAEGGFFTTDWTRGFHAPMPHLTRLRAVGRLLKLSAVVRAHRGDIDGAMEDVRLMLRLPRTMKDEPAIISGMVAQMLEVTAYGTLQAVLDAGLPGREAVMRMQEELNKREDMNTLELQWLGQAAMGLDEMERLRRGDLDVTELAGPTDDEPGGRLVTNRTFFRLVWVAPADESLFLSIMNRYVEISRLPYPERLAATDPYGAAGIWQDDWQQLPYAWVTRMLVPGLSRVTEQTARQDARARLARSVLVLTLYRIDTGRYPETLEELVPAYMAEVETDPFTGKALLYKRRKEGFVVYSTGADGRDDGGVWDSVYTSVGDITWERRR